MKLSTTLALTVGAGVVAFLAGRLTQPASIQEADVPSGLQTKFSARATSSNATRETADSAIRAMGKYAACGQEFSAENAAKLSSDERLELLAMGASVGDFGNQAAMLCGLVSVLTKEELPMAKKIFETMESQGNRLALDVWQSLWQQWGRLDPVACFNLLREDPLRKSASDERNVMAGWLETDADAALAWAYKPEKTVLESAAAAFAITQNANADLKQLEAAILKITGNGPIALKCMDDYFDLVSLRVKDQTNATIYDGMPAELKPIAWAVTAKRMGYEDPATAKAWVTEHATDQGCYYDGISDLFDTLSHQDPEGTVKWAIQLPFSESSYGNHPALRPFLRWRERDPVAVAAWLKTQPPVAPWLPNFEY